MAAFGAFYGLLFARPLFRKIITNPTVADIVAAIVIALVILVICTIINAKITSKLRKSVLSGLDRILGFAFGVLRGLLLAFIVFYFAVYAFKKETMEEYTDKNFSLPYLEKTMPVVESILPEDVIKGIQGMTKKQQVTTENVEIKEKPVIEKEVKKETKKEEETSYDEQDLESMDSLIEGIE